ncbi:hypothetical protein [Phocoenobacter skyensis]|nr:hypothetical protein [Pasteurella skyensis]MDP8079881.1 hypothetical protein [Pasteurella skyensis]MDP8085797.1 hypothetical protein [Pasteurella skyensis]MDP8185980.1 hypothetical protein [Pasteurella skyensis]QLB21883.1 hypothetical protein A6B44_01115 [Pasteurella skyensis]
MNIYHFFKIAVIVFFALISFWILSITTFNPISNYEAIHTVKNIVDKVRTYESKIPLSKDEITLYYQTIHLSKEEISLIEKYGLQIHKIGSGYEVTISQGFDKWVIYNSEDDCWYGTKNIIGLKQCSKSL